MGCLPFPAHLLQLTASPWISLAHAKFNVNLSQINLRLPVNCVGSKKKKKPPNNPQIFIFLKHHNHFLMVPDWLLGAAAAASLCHQQCLRAIRHQQDFCGDGYVFSCFFLFFLSLAACPIRSFSLVCHFSSTSCIPSQTTDQYSCICTALPQYLSRRGWRHMPRHPLRTDMTLMMWVQLSPCSFASPVD